MGNQQFSMTTNVIIVGIIVSQSVVYRQGVAEPLKSPKTLIPKAIPKQGHIPRKPNCMSWHTMAQIVVGLDYTHTHRVWYKVFRYDLVVHPYSMPYFFYYFFLAWSNLAILLNPWFQYMHIWGEIKTGEVFQLWRVWTGQSR